MKGYVNLTHTNNGKLKNYYKKDETYSKEEIDSKVTGVYKAKGSVQNYTDLPTENNSVGDVYNVINKYNDYPAGTNFVWTEQGTWDALGGIGGGGSVPIVRLPQVV